MISRVAFLLLFSQVVWLVPSSAIASSRIGTSSDLRSAYLLDAGLVRYSHSALTPDQFRREVQRHFAAVIRILRQKESESLEIAIQRLQSRLNLSERDLLAMKDALRENRKSQIRRLEEYAAAGEFPKNYRFESPQPIFVDAANKACAVGHLMRMSGLDEDVHQIRRTRNLVRILDLSRGAATDWIAASGLTKEEAAIIQPGYPLLHGTDCAVERDNVELNNEWFGVLTLREGTVLRGLRVESETGFESYDSSYWRAVSDVELEYHPAVVDNEGTIIPPISVTNSFVLPEHTWPEMPTAHLNGMTVIDGEFETWQTEATYHGGHPVSCLFVPSRLPDLDFEQRTQRWGTGTLENYGPLYGERLENVLAAELSDLNDVQAGVSFIDGSEAIDGRSAVLRGAEYRPAALFRQSPTTARYVEFDYAGDKPLLVSYYNDTLDPSEEGVLAGACDYEDTSCLTGLLFAAADELVEIAPGRLRGPVRGNSSLFAIHALDGQTIVVDNFAFVVPEPANGHWWAVIAVFCVVARRRKRKQ